MDLTNLPKMGSSVDSQVATVLGRGQFCNTARVPTLQHEVSAPHALTRGIEHVRHLAKSEHQGLGFLAQRLSRALFPCFRLDLVPAPLVSDFRTPERRER